ncbi:ABC transporter ATP-binding protein [Enterococcus avium]
MRIGGQIAIEGREIKKEFVFGNSKTIVLKKVSLKINSGEFVSIMGPSGSGKSTLLYILSGIDEPTEGTVLLKNQNIYQFNDDEMSILRRRKIGFIFQFYNLVPNLSVEENILLPILLDGKKLSDFSGKLDRIIDIVGLSDRKKHKPRELSGGQQQRVAIARSLINDPDILFADEPTGNLDSKTGKEILSLLRRINIEHKKTILMVTHSQDAASYGNRIISMKDGGIVG